MTLERNCMNTIKPDFDINNISKMIEKHVYPNLFKSLQVAISIPISGREEVMRKQSPPVVGPNRKKKKYSHKLSDLLKIVFFCEAHKKLVTNQYVSALM